MDTYEDAQLKKLLSPLKSITPDSAYMSRSKQLITFARQKAPVVQMPLYTRFAGRMLESFTFSAGLALASLFIIIALGSLSYLTGPAQDGAVATSLNNDSLALEAESIDFNMQIKEISYFDESAKQVALALEKISEQSDETIQP